MNRSVVFLCLAVLSLSACAMQRADQAASAKTALVGMTKEQIFSCMGAPQTKGIVDTTEVWSYKSTNGHEERTKQTAGKAVWGVDLGLSDEVRERRFCVVHVVMKNNVVTVVNYNGPTGGWMSEDEQCAYAVRNCLK